jgi:hypothetical protein
MSVSIKDLKEWLDEFDEIDGVGIDDGGLALCRFSHTENSMSTYEIGGVPDDEEFLRHIRAAVSA